MLCWKIEYDDDDDDDDDDVVYLILLGIKLVIYRSQLSSPNQSQTRTLSVVLSCISHAGSWHGRRDDATMQTYTTCTHQQSRCKISCIKPMQPLTKKLTLISTFDLLTSGSVHAAVLRWAIVYRVWCP